MADFNELNDPELEALAVALRENRPEPEADFAEKLDTAVADHFPKEWTDDANPGRRSFSDWLTRHFGNARQVLLPATAGLAGLLVVAVVVGVGMNGGGSTDSSSDGGVISSESSSAGDSTAASAGAEATVDQDSAGGAAPEPAAPQFNDLGKTRTGVTLDPQSATIENTSKSPGVYAAGTDDRKVAYETDITLGTDPDNVQDVSNDIVGVVDDHNGIVLDSSVEDGPAGQAGADFSLMIPSAQLESAVSDLSGLADLRSRNQETEDITAPTLTVEDSLRDSRARVDSLVKELSEATTDEDRARIEDELAQERRQTARLSTRLNKLERRASLTPVSVVVETGGDTSSDEDDSAWGVGDAFDDAGRMLGVAAGVTLIALAIAVPIGLVLLIALALNRAWVRHSRRRALEDN